MAAQVGRPAAGQRQRVVIRPEGHRGPGSPRLPVGGVEARPAGAQLQGGAPGQKVHQRRPGALLLARAFRAAVQGLPQGAYVFHVHVPVSLPPGAGRGVIIEFPTYYNTAQGKGQYAGQGDGRRSVKRTRGKNHGEIFAAR